MIIGIVNENEGAEFNSHSILFRPPRAMPLKNELIHLPAAVDLEMASSLGEENSEFKKIQALCQVLLLMTHKYCHGCSTRRDCRITGLMKWSR